MNENPDELRDDAEKKALNYFPRHDHTLVAQIAASLAQGRGLSGPQAFATVAEDAIYLLDAVQKTCEERERRIAHIIEIRLRPEKMEYPEGVKFITGETRLDRAEEKFLGFMQSILRADIHPHTLTPSALNKTINHYKERGFPPHQLAEMPEKFSRWKESADGRKNKADKGDIAQPAKKVLGGSKKAKK